jgi:glycoside hydrolase-like protein
MVPQAPFGDLAAENAAAAAWCADLDPCAGPSAKPGTAVDDIIDLGTRDIRRPAGTPRMPGARRPNWAPWGMMLLPLVVLALLLVALSLIVSATKKPGPVTDIPAPAPFSFSGLGFDVCQTPEASEMKRWLASPYRAVFVFIGGNDMACAQTHLTRSWVTKVEAQGWTILPMYTGRQPAFGEVKVTSATDAVARVRSLGLPSNVPIFYGPCTQDTIIPESIVRLDPALRTLSAPRVTWPAPIS